MYLTVCKYNFYFLKLSIRGWLDSIHEFCWHSSCTELGPVAFLWIINLGLLRFSDWTWLNPWVLVAFIMYRTRARSYQKQKKYKRGLLRFSDPLIASGFLDYLLTMGAAFSEVLSFGQQGPSKYHELGMQEIKSISHTFLVLANTNIISLICKRTCSCLGKRWSGVHWQY